MHCASSAYSGTMQVYISIRVWVIVLFYIKLLSLHIVVMYDEEQKMCVSVIDVHVYTLACMRARVCVCVCVCVRACVHM